MLYTFKNEMPMYTDGHIIVADNGSVFINAGELHVIEGRYHFVYDGSWYIINKMGERVKLDPLMRPVADFKNEVIADEEILAKITEEHIRKEHEEE